MRCHECHVRLALISLEKKTDLMWVATFQCPSCGRNTVMPTDYWGADIIRKENEAWNEGNQLGETEPEPMS